VQYLRLSAACLCWQSCQSWLACMWSSVHSCVRSSVHCIARLGGHCVVRAPCCVRLGLSVKLCMRVCEDLPPSLRFRTASSCEASEPAALQRSRPPEPQKVRYVLLWMSPWPLKTASCFSRCGIVSVFPFCFVALRVRFCFWE
jgi:hypothetical protein